MLTRDRLSAMNVWNEEAAIFDEYWAALAGPGAVRDRRRLELRAGMRVLDIGCGSGGFCALAPRAARRRAGSTPRPAMIEIARAAGARRGPAHRCDGRSALGRRRLRRVTGFNSLQFADDPVAALREWVRVVRPGGKLAVCVWGPREDNEVEVLESALRELAGTRRRRGGRSGARAFERRGARSRA